MRHLISLAAVAVIGWVAVQWIQLESQARGDRDRTGKAASELPTGDWRASAVLALDEAEARLGAAPFGGPRMGVPSPMTERDVEWLREATGVDVPLRREQPSTPLPTRQTVRRGDLTRSRRK